MNNIASDRQSIIVIGLSYGDEGKGTITDYLTRTQTTHTIIRFNGGPQAAHNVVTTTGISHTFAQFGSGTLVPGTETYLSAYMLVDPPAIEIEAKVLRDKGIEDALARLTIDDSALVVTPIQKLVNRIQELARGSQRHGSCGKGVGQAVFDYQAYPEQALCFSDLADTTTLEKRLRFWQHHHLEQLAPLLVQGSDNIELRLYQQRLSQPELVPRLVAIYNDFFFRTGVRRGNDQLLAETLKQSGKVIWEGAQGVLLDREYGFWPHVTKTRTTDLNATTLLAKANYTNNIQRIGVLRAYATKHGAGPFITEDRQLTATIPDLHNQHNPWQAEFRVGWFDLVAAQYACQIAGNLDYLAITNLDRLRDVESIKVCVAYRYLGKPSDELEQFFSLDLTKEKNPIITSIRVFSHPNREHQTQLTQLLSQCQPIYREFPSKYELDYLQFLQDNLALPIKIVSRGATAADKHFEG